MSATTAGVANAQCVCVKNSIFQTTSGTQYNYHVTYPNSNDERQAIANWLSPLNFNTSQNEFIQKRENGTGEWLLESQEFKEWRDGTSEALWCPGRAGAGKTILASIAVNHLRTTFDKDDAIAITFMYCNYKEQAEQTISNLVASLLKQMVQNRSAISDDVKSFWERHQRQNARPTLDQVADALKSEIETYSKVFIVVDALDECREDDATRAKLLKVLRSLGGNVNLMVTSRDLPSIARDFEETKSLYIHAKDEDIRIYLEGRIAVASRHLKRLQETIVNRIVEKASGMFLLARLHMDSLVGKFSTAEVRKALENLPEGMDDMYDKAMARVERQDDGQKKLAKRVLSWITYVFRPLSVEELQHALAVELDTTCIDPEAIIDEEILTSVCAGLVVIDEDQRIRLVHYTAQQYFEHRRESHFPNAPASIAAICITYLSFDIFDTGSCDTYERQTLLLRSCPFLSYAARCWGDHARGQEEAIKSLVLNFLQDNSKVACASQILMAGFRIRLNYSGLHLSFFFGLEKVVAYQLENGANANCRGNDGRSPLSMRFQFGNAWNITSIEFLIHTSHYQEYYRHSTNYPPASESSRSPSSNQPQDPSPGRASIESNFWA